jgi:hypothetical protein
MIGDHYELKLSSISDLRRSIRGTDPCSNSPMGAAAVVATPRKKPLNGDAPRW